MQWAGTASRRSSSNDQRGTDASVWGVLFRVVDFNPDCRPVGVLKQLPINNAPAHGGSYYEYLLAGAAYTEEYLVKRELSSSIRLGDDELHLALEAANTVVWEFDVRSGRGRWFGDLRIIFGISSETYAESMKEFMGRVHPEDIKQVSEALVRAEESREPCAAEFRVTGLDGVPRWLIARGKFYYARTGEPQRMLAMVRNITERKQAEEALRASEEQFRSVFTEAGVGMVIVSTDGRFLAANPAFCECLGYTEEELLTKTVQSITFEEDWPAFSKKLGRALEQGRGFQRFEKRCLHKSGRIVCTESTASLIRDSHGVPMYFVGEVLDVTQRKESEEALSSFNQRLIQTQEQERIRIARELHDDISQRLALLAIGLDQLRGASAGLSGDMLKQISNIRKEALDLSTDIRHLSHELHSSGLEFLGVQSAIRSWCNEFSKKHKMEIQFESQDIPSSLAPEVSLTLYRVSQEALNNAAKHSGARHFDVRLRGTPNEIHLTVSDRGVGFDPADSVNGRGLGLTSMRERLKLVNGKLEIESGANRGTTIFARVPLSSYEQSAQSTGAGRASKVFPDSGAFRAAD